MEKITSKLSGWVGRAVKVVMVALVIPLTAGLLLGFLEQLDIPSLSGSTFRQFVVGGFAAYVGVHVLLYRPVGWFQASHRLFSTLAVWLFGGQVASTERSAPAPKVKPGKTGKSDGGPRGGSAEGSTLVAFSPYVVPLYTMLTCAAAWLAAQWIDRRFIDGPAGVLIGATMAFQWVMTADDLQPQRERWHLETYLLAIGLIVVLTLVIAGACAPWAIPEFSFARAMSEGLTHTQAILTSVVQQLFF
ncbi:MAG: hypothetical protein COV75_06680 [Candidatus Omnitrophica bacterium CG11_big_fil_rev_8_21_14_0_20_63_9]|nr:MAG: hypothetical protein COV75_06680 [Candidatus Omnitrophica bacterium CG11_big_fil_rev_8_21_14_0_20_63_9]